MRNKTPETGEKRQAGIFKVNIETPLGPIRSSVTVETGPMRLAELAPSAFELTEILAKRAVQREKDQGFSISCGPGCGACCRHMVPVSAPEAFFIYDFLKAIRPEVRQSFLSGFQSIVQFMKEKKLVDFFFSETYDDDKAIALAETYFTWGLPCPFLVDESCSIYPYRPTTCREYLVTSPAEFCSDPFSGKVRKVFMPKPLYTKLAHLTAELTRLEVRLIPLGLVPAWVESHMDIYRKTWPGLDLFKKFIASIGPPPPDREKNSKKGNQK